MWETRLSTVDWVYLKTQILLETMRILNQPREESYAFSESQTFVPINWMCKKQTSVSHSSTESEIISLNTGLRLDGLPALELWDLIVSVLGNISRFVGCGDRSVTFIEEYRITNPWCNRKRLATSRILPVS